MKDHLEVCEAAARAGGRVLQEWLGKFGVSNKGPRDLVTEADIASQREIRRIVLEAFPDHGFIGEESIHDDGHGGAGDAGGFRWHVDPLDGTSNYVHGFPAYCVSVALARGDEILAATIHDPLHDECFTARAGGGAFLNGRRIAAARKEDPVDALVAVSFPPQVGRDSQAVGDFLDVLPHVHAVRRTGSTAINLAYVACGRLDAFWVRRIASWDVAAGLLIAAEAGAAIGPFAGGPAGPVSLEAPSFITACTPRLLECLQRFMDGCERSG
jgi:myo-inositol-1(or 4)-monophosphatase